MIMNKAAKNIYVLYSSLISSQSFSLSWNMNFTSFFMFFFPSTLKCNNRVEWAAFDIYIYIYFLLYGRIELFTFFVVCFRVSKKSSLEFLALRFLCTDSWAVCWLQINFSYHHHWLPWLFLPMSLCYSKPWLYSTISVSNLVVSILHWVLPFLINPRRVVDLSVCLALVRIESEIEAPYMHYRKSHH